MHWFQILLIVLLSQNLLLVFFIGKEREPRTAASVFKSIIINALIIWGVLAYWGV